MAGRAAAHEAVIAGTAEDGVRSLATIEVVIAGAAQDEVVAATAEEPVVLHVARHCVAEIAADDLLEVRHGVDADRIGPRALPDHPEVKPEVDLDGRAFVAEAVEAGAPIERVEACAADEQVVARAAEQRVVSAPAVDRVGPGASDHDVVERAAHDGVVPVAGAERDAGDIAGLRRLCGVRREDDRVVAAERVELRAVDVGPGNDCIEVHNVVAFGEQRRSIGVTVDRDRQLRGCLTVPVGDRVGEGLLQRFAVVQVLERRIGLVEKIAVGPVGIQGERAVEAAQHAGVADGRVASTMPPTVSLASTLPAIVLEASSSVIAFVSA